MRKLYRDTFITLKLAAEEFGGIGYGSDIVEEYNIKDGFSNVPHCAWGLVYGESRNFNAPVSKLDASNSKRITISRSDNDAAVLAILKSKYSSKKLEQFSSLRRNAKEVKISFAQWCRKLNISSTEYIDEDIPGEMYLVPGTNDNPEFYIAPLIGTVP